MITKYTCLALLLASLLGLSACQKDALRSESVVDQYLNQEGDSDLDEWIRATFTPYNIRVSYRWRKEYLPSNALATPPHVERVRPVLEAIHKLWIDLYEEAGAGGKDFIKDKKILRITLLGGSEMQSNGVLLKLWYPEMSSHEIFLFDVNNFDPRNKASVYRLMRSVHHQFARRLIEQIPYERDAFASILPEAYGLLGLAPSEADAPRRVGLSPYAHRLGFYSLHAMTQAEEEFADLISLSLMHSAVELYEAEETAARPTGADTAESLRQGELSKEAMRRKRAFVEDYFRQEVGISLSRLQLLSLRHLNNYYNEYNSR